ncbi:MAG TPA: S53 family peptidase [Terriglobales bacterium]|nr:S53 family peptidase [Terriglobales bacterium]
MSLSRRLWKVATAASLGLGILGLMASSALAAMPSHAKNMGPEDQSKRITVTVWLNQHNKASLDALVQQMYDKNSPNYHHFMTAAQYKANFAPTAKETSTVRSFLASHNLTVSRTDLHNHFVVASGRVGDVQKAFNTQINRVMVNGRMHRTNVSEPSITGAAASLVNSVGGLSDLEYQSYAKPKMDLETAGRRIAVSPSAVGSDGLFFSAQCLYPPQLVTFKTNGGLPSATYFGNRYGADINSDVPNLSPCGYDSAEIQQAYGLNRLYSHGLDGTGQTIVIVDAYGSNTLLDDANLFSAFNGLPQLTSSNFTIYTPGGPVNCAKDCIAGNWQFETTLDVEWAHSVAPGANIALVLAPTASFSDLDAANFFAISNQLGNVISNSFGIPEILLVDFLPSELTIENGLSEIAAALGISHNISTGDSGDNLALDRLNGVDAVSPGANADSPFATGIGGTSTFLDSKHNIELQTGWGTNAQRIAEASPNPPTIPPLLLGFEGGAGGGTSVVYRKPRYQRSLPGRWRLQPDISMNADPETGNEIIVTPDSVPGHPQEVAVFGGTSLSTPMFSALWSIANQAAGGGPIGEAAPILYELPSSAIKDVTPPVFSPFNVTGIILNPPNPPQFESAKALAQPLENTKFFLSTLFNSPNSTRWDVITFGTDSSLTVNFGWDNVTGLGTPNGEDFIKAVLREVR